VRRGATEGLVAKLADYEGSDLPERTKAALRLARTAFSIALPDCAVLDIGLPGRDGCAPRST